MPARRHSKNPRPGATDPTEGYRRFSAAMLADGIRCAAAGDEDAMEWLLDGRASLYATYLGMELTPDTLAAALSRVQEATLPGKPLRASL